MDPVGAIFDSLSKIFGFDPLFITFTFVLGYLLFFIFFFKSTTYWGELATADRFFFGFILGFTMFSLLSLISVPVAFFMASFFGEVITFGSTSFVTVTTVLYLIPIFFLAFMISFRLKIKGPLVSNEAYDKLIDFLQNHRNYWVYLFAIGSAVIYIFVGSSNPFISSSTVSLWQGLIILLNAFLFLGPFPILLIIGFLCHFETSTPYHEMIDTIFSFCFPVTELSKVFITLKKSRFNKLSSLYKNGRRMLRYVLTSSYLRKIILVVFFSFLIILAEGVLHVFSPTVALIETNYDFSEIEIHNDLKGSTVYTVDVVKTYWLTMPIHIVRNIDLTIDNPSNFSIHDSARGGSWGTTVYLINIENDPQLVVTSEMNSSDEIDGFDVTLPQNMSKETRPYIKLSYKDQLNLDLIETIGPYETKLQNGSVAVTSSLIINNSMDRPLSSTYYSLFETENYGNMTAVSRQNDGKEIPSPAILDQNGWIQIPVYVQPHTSLTITVTCVFEELTI